MCWEEMDFKKLSKSYGKIKMIERNKGFLL